MRCAHACVMVIVKVGRRHAPLCPQHQLASCALALRMDIPQAHLWDSSYVAKTSTDGGLALDEKGKRPKRARGRQVYLGGFESEIAAAQAFDRCVHVPCARSVDIPYIRIYLVMIYIYSEREIAAVPGMRPVRASLDSSIGLNKQTLTEHAFSALPHPPLNPPTRIPGCSLQVSRSTIVCF